ncbi:autotransporter domain-containing protein [Lysobacter gummosus]|uniref:autotransporter outer membrane beta-barrel domain-containing protein n=1 Tax=Lysobacter gummosus TaxID=262324 RepID=UPI00363CC758
MTLQLTQLELARKAPERSIRHPMGTLLIRSALAAAVGLGLQFPGVAQAADPVSYWNSGNGGSGVWNASNANWMHEDGTVGTWTPGVAVFRVAGPGDTVTVEGAQVFTGMQFTGNSSGNSGYRLLGGAGGELSIGTPQASIFIDSFTSALIDAPIVGTGGLNMLGNGDLVLTGANTYAGDTTLSGGRLWTANDGSLGGGALRFAGGTLVVQGSGFATSRDIEIATNGSRIQLQGGEVPRLDLKGNVSGTGTLQVSGRGGVLFSHRNDNFSGGIEVSNAGKITATVTGAFGTGPLAAYDFGEIRFESQASAADLNITLTDGFAGRTVSTLRFADRADAGRANIAIENLYGQVLFEDESSAGSAHIGNGRFGSVSFRGSSSADHASIVLARGSTAVTFSEFASGGQATIVGAGTVGFYDNASADGLSIAGADIVNVAGMSRALSIGSISSGSLVKLGDTTLNLGGLGREDAIGGIEGAGTLVKTGTGTLAIVRASGLFTGKVQVEQGRLRVDAFHSGAFNVGPEGTLFGNGRLRELVNEGTVAPGASIGTLTVDGDYVQRAGARLQVEVAADGSSDRLAVGGRALLEGGTLDVIKAPGQYAYGTRYTLIDAQGGLSGRFDAMAQNQPFLKLALAYDAQHAYLDVLRSDTSFTDVCDTFNRCGVAAAVDGIAASGRPSADMEAVIEEMTTLSVAGAAAAMDRLSGEAHASFAGALLDEQALFGQELSRRVLAQHGADESARGGGAWIRAYGASSQIDGDANAHGLDIDTRGTALGMDGWLNDAVLIGASVEFKKLDADLRAGDKGKADIGQLNLYASLHGEKAYLNGALGYGQWDNKIERSLQAGDISRRAQASYDGHSYSAYLEGGWNFDFGSSRLQPLLGVAYSRLDNDGFRERGAQDVGLVGRSLKIDRTTASLGLRWIGDFTRGEWTMSPSLEVRALRSYGDEYADLDVGFEGAPGFDFGIRGAALPKQRGMANLGLQASHGERISLFLDYGYQHGDEAQSRNVGLGLRYRW